MADSLSSTVFWLSLCTSGNCSTMSCRLSSFTANLAVGLDCFAEVSSVSGKFGLLVSMVSYADECNISFALCNLRKTAASFELHKDKQYRIVSNKG